MPNIPYPEFVEFKMRLSNKVLVDNEPVEGYALLIMNELPNCVKDILISLRCCFRYRTEDGTTHTVLLYEEIQRNSTPFDESGLPEGEYEFPFSFSCPDDLPPSLTIGHDSDSVSSCKVWYEIRSYVMHTENHPTLDRKHLRTAVRFQRYYSSGNGPNKYIITNDKPEPLHYAFGHVKVQVQLDRQVFRIGQPVTFRLGIYHDMLRSISSVKCYLKQVLSVKKRAVRQVKEYNSISVVGFRELNQKGVPVRRKQHFSTNVSIKANPTLDEAGCMAVAGGQERVAFPALSGTFERHGAEGVSVSYILEIHLSVVLSSDLVVSVPYITAFGAHEEDENKPPSYWIQRATDEKSKADSDPETSTDPKTNMLLSQGDLPTYHELVSEESLSQNELALPPTPKYTPSTLRSSVAESRTKVQANETAKADTTISTTTSMSMQFQTQPQTQPSDKKTTTTNTTTTTTTTTTPHTIRKDTQDAPQSRKQDSATQNDPKSAPKSGPGPEVGNKLIGRLDAYEPIAEVSDETSSLTALSEAEAYNEDMSRTPLGTRYIRAGGGSTATTTTTTSTTTSATFAKNQSQNPNQSPNQSPFTDERLPTTPLAYPFSAHLLDDMPQRRERAHSHNISSQSEEKRPTQRRLSNVQSFNAGVRMMSMNALVASMDEINTNVNLAELNANVHHVVDDEKTEGEDEEELEYAPPPARLRGPSLAELSEVFRRKSIADVGSSISQFNQQRLADSAVANEIIEEDSGLDLTEEQV